MKRILTILICAVFTTNILFASGSNEKLESTSNSESEKTKIVFLRAGTEETKKEAYNKIIELFEAQNPDIEVEYQESPWGDDIETKLNTGFASGIAPDVINYSLASMGQRIPLGQYEVLNSYVEGWEGLDDFYPSVLEAGSIGDNLYGIAYLADPLLLAVNTEMLNEVGIMNPPTNWEELYDAHLKLIKKDSNGVVTQTGVALPKMGFGIFQWIEIFGFQNGAKNLVDETDNTILFNQPPMVEALAFLNKINEAGIIPYEKADDNPFITGKAAMCYMSPSWFRAYNIDDLEGKITMVPPVTNKTEGTFCGMHFMFMNSQSKNKEAAWKFMQFLTSKESMKIWVDITGTPPLRQSLTDEYIQSNPEWGAYVLDAISIGVGAPKVAYSNSLFTVVNEGMEKVFFGQSTPQEAMDAAAVKLQKEIDNQ